MKTVAMALVVLAASLPQAIEPSSLQISISSAKLEFNIDEPIVWTMTIQNVSSGPLRVIKPDSYLVGKDTPAPSAAFVIEREDGRIARPIPACFTDGLGDTAEKVSMILAPSAKLVTDVSMVRCWSYTFGSEPIDLQREILKPRPFPAGRYRVSVKYGFPPGTYSRRWWAFLGHGVRDNGVNEPPALLVEEPWRGEVTSNTVSISVK